MFTNNEKAIRLVEKVKDLETWKEHFDSEIWENFTEYVYNVKPENGRIEWTSEQQNAIDLALELGISLVVFVESTDFGDPFPEIDDRDHIDYKRAVTRHAFELAKEIKRNEKDDMLLSDEDAQLLASWLEDYAWSWKYSMCGGTLDYE